MEHLYFGAENKLNAFNGKISQFYLIVKTLLHGEVLNQLSTKQSDTVKEKALLTWWDVLHYAEKYFLPTERILL